jgi:L-galactono-1,4-lactone dehydrogenase
VPVQKLQERTFVATTKEVAANHAKWLRSNKHMRYMWLPYTDSVVVVQVRSLVCLHMGAVELLQQ